MLGVDPVRFQLDMFQPPLVGGSGAPSWWEGALERIGLRSKGDGGGSGAEGSLFERALIVFSILPAPPPAPTAWELSASFLARARQGLAAIAARRSAGPARRRLVHVSGQSATPPEPLNEASTPLLLRAVMILEMDTHVDFKTNDYEQRDSRYS